MRPIQFHIEGGVNKAQDIEMRRAFHRFFDALNQIAREKGSGVKYTLHGTRREAYEQFCHALKREPQTYHVLLVDSEDPVAHRGECWHHLRERQADGWAKPAGAEDAQCHLMVQAIEAWFFADPQTLQEYYGPDFNANALTVRQNVEAIPKSEHISKLKAASRPTKKGEYHKTRHLPDILGKLHTAEVRLRAWHCDRVFVTLSEKLGSPMTALCMFPQDQ